MDKIITPEPHQAVIRDLVQALERAERHQGKRWLTRSREETDAVIRVPV